MSQESEGRGSLRKRCFPTAHRLLVERELEAVCFGDRESVLVVGAGDDPYRRFVARADRYVTLDIRKTQPDLTLVGDAHLLPFAAGSFDCLVASEVVEHLARPTDFAFEARRVLRPGALLVATVPFMFHIHGDPFDYQRLTASGLMRLFESFTSVEVVPVGGRIAVCWDLTTTALAPRSYLAPLRVANHVIRLLPHRGSTRSTAPSGYVVVATK